MIIKLALFKLSKEGTKLISVYWDGIKLAIKFVDKEAIKIKIKAKFVISKLSTFPIISEGFVSIWVKFSLFCFKKASTPITMNRAIIEKKN